MNKILENYWQVFSYGYLAHLVRYFALAGLAYLLFYVFLRRKAIHRKIQLVFPKRAEVQREILYSLSSLAIFAAVGVLTLIMRKAGWINLYFDINRHGWGYLAISTVTLIFLHDTWFYWTHRLMHTRRLFPIMHRVHHLSHNPTPWAAFAFHPTEALVQAMVFPVVALFLPLHPITALVWLLYMTVLNVLGHLGFEILPKGFVRNWWTRWHNTSVHHNMHHRHVNCNYGLYFNIWDQLMRTNHAHYEREYERVTEGERVLQSVAEPTRQNTMVASEK